MGSPEPSATLRRPGPGGGGTPPPVTVPRGAYVGVSLAAIVVGAVALVRGTRGVVTIQDSDLTNFFFPAADKILQGNPWAIYAVRASGNYPNYNPPVSIFLMAPLLALARALGFAANPGELITFVSMPFLAFVLLLGYVTVVALRRLFPAIPETQRFLAYLLMLFSPLVWQNFTNWYHLEQPMMLALLVAAVVLFQARREGLAGLLAGLAVLSRTTAIVPLIAFGVLLIVGREWRALLRFGSIAALVAGVGFAPFFLFDRRDTTYSLVSWRGTAEIGGNSIWALFKYDGTAAASPLRYTLDHVVRRLDMYTVILVVAVVAFLAARRLRVSGYGREAWAVLAIATLAVPMLSKNNWPYYYLEPFVFLLVWEFASMHDRRTALWRWPVLTFGFLSIAATLSQFIGLRSVGALDRVAVGLVEFGAMLAFAVAVWYRVQAGRVEPALAPQVARQMPDRQAGMPAPSARGALADAAAPAPGAPRGYAAAPGPYGPPAPPPEAPAPLHTGWTAPPAAPGEGAWPAFPPPAQANPMPGWPAPTQPGQSSSKNSPPQSPRTAEPGW